jgi:F0F1-type ATP synthase membrane subunit c/vacuolar-type H+-ATPase subunit K
MTDEKKFFRNAVIVLAVLEALVMIPLVLFIALNK